VARPAAVALLSAGVQFPRAPQNRAEWWNLWKRIAGGLDRAHQLRLHGEIGPGWCHVSRARRRSNPRGREARAQEIREMWQAIGAASASTRGSSGAGDGIVADIERGKVTSQQLWGLVAPRRREPIAGTPELRRRSDVVSAWIERVLALREWPQPEGVASRWCSWRASSTIGSAICRPSCATASRRV